MATDQPRWWRTDPIGPLRAEFLNRNYEGVPHGLASTSGHSRFALWGCALPWPPVFYPTVRRGRSYSEDARSCEGRLREMLMVTLLNSKLHLRIGVQVWGLT